MALRGREPSAKTTLLLSGGVASKKAAFSLAFVMLSIPLLAMAAVLLGLWLTGTELNITAMMGMAMVVGIVTEVAIFLSGLVAEPVPTVLPRPWRKPPRPPPSREGTVCIAVPLLFLCTWSDLVDVSPEDPMIWKCIRCRLRQTDQACVPFCEVCYRETIVDPANPPRYHSKKKARKGKRKNRRGRRCNAVIAVPRLKLLRRRQRTLGDDSDSLGWHDVVRVLDDLGS